MRLPKSGPYHYILAESPFMTVHNDSPNGLSRDMPPYYLQFEGRAGNSSQTGAHVYISYVYLIK